MVSRGRRLQRPTIAARAHRDDAGVHFQGEPIAAEPKRAAHLRGAERGMPGKRHLVSRREDAHARAGTLGRQDEGGLRKIELQRERLHPCAVERLRPLEHAQRVAAERSSALREDVEEAIGVGCHLSRVF